MTLARAHGAVIVGVEALVVEIEAFLAQGLPGISIIGLADTAVGEARDRVRAAIHNCQLPWPSERRITVGLSPASIHKKGASLDLGIALSLLAAQEQVPTLEGVLAFGELALDGRVCPVKGALVATIAAKKAGIKTVIVSNAQVREASLVTGVDVVGAATLSEAVAFVRGQEIPPSPSEPIIPVSPSSDLDMSEVRGQGEARLALEVAAAGGHHAAFLGSPGVGKTMLAERLPTLLPQLDADTSLDVTAIHSVAGRLADFSGLITQPPFESPHHTATMASLIGGGSSHIRIGLVTLAHSGVLFLDEAAEFDRRVLDALRQPMESGVVSVARSGFSLVMPARFQLVIASNPCPCGKFVGTGADCSCTPLSRRRYFSRLSGPLLDRIDIRVTLEKPTLAQLDSTSGSPESSSVIRARVLQARERAAHRMRELPWHLNAQVPGAIMRRLFPIDIDTLAREPISIARASSHPVSRQSNRTSGMSMRGQDRVLRMAWTFADLNGHDKPSADDIDSAIKFRDGDGTWQV